MVLRTAGPHSGEEDHGGRCCDLGGPVFSHRLIRLYRGMLRVCSGYAQGLLRVCSEVLWRTPLARRTLSPGNRWWGGNKRRAQNVTHHGLRWLLWCSLSPGNRSGRAHKVEPRIRSASRIHCTFYSGFHLVGSSRSVSGREAAPEELSESHSGLRVCSLPTICFRATG